MFKYRISAATERRRENRSSQKKDPILDEREGKSVRTPCHVLHIPDLPSREITIEVSTSKHCTTATKKSPRIKNGLEKRKRREHCSKIELVLPQKEEGK